VNAALGPPEPAGVGVRRLVRTDTMQTPKRHPGPVTAQLHGGHHLALALLAQLPAPHVMTARDDPWTDAFGDPRLHDEVADFGFHAHQIAGVLRQNLIASPAG
jgi:hypothetical protein